MSEDQRQPSDAAIWSMTVDTRFGPDYLSIEPYEDEHGVRRFDFIANETTDPVDGYQMTGIILTQPQLVELQRGIELALSWRDRDRPSPASQ